MSNVLLCDTADEVASLQYLLLREAPDLLVEVTTDAFRAVEIGGPVRPDVVACDLGLERLGGRRARPPDRAHPRPAPA